MHAQKEIFSLRLHREKFFNKILIFFFFFFGPVGNGHITILFSGAGIVSWTPHPAVWDTIWTMSLLRMNRRRSWNKRRWLSWWWAFSRSTRFSPPEHPPRQAGRPILPTSGWCPSSTGIPRVNCLVFVTYSIFLNISQNDWHFFVL